MSSKPKKSKAKKVEEEVDKAGREVEKEVIKAGRGIAKAGQKIKKEVGRAPQRRKVAPARPAGRAPDAMVTSRHGTGVVIRLGRGFSMGEISGAGMAPRLATRWGVRLDSRRRSVIQGNVDSLKKWSSHPGAAKKAERVVRELEQEVEKVAVKVKAEAVEVEEEAAKVEREVRGEAARAGKAIELEGEKAEKSAKRKAKPKKKADS